jgi:hypothetical protein
MQKSNAPTKLTIVFASGAGAGPVNAVPLTPGATSGTASYQTGFTSVNMEPTASGGVPPFGADFNGLFQDSTKARIWQQAGYMYPFDATFAGNSNIGGYPAGSVLMMASGKGLWLNQSDNNSVNPDTTGASGWLGIAAAGTSTINTTGGTVTPDPSALGVTTLLITGALTANASVVLPLNAGAKWIVVNNTTGSFTVTVQGATGTGVQVAQGTSNAAYVFTDGTNFYATSANVSGLYLPINGNAVSASKLANARTIAMSGDVAWSVSFDGSANVTASGTIQAGAVSLSKMANLTANTLLGNPTASAATPQAITLANGLVFSGTTLGMGAITPTSIASSGAVSGTTGTFNNGLTAGATTLSGTLTITAQQAQVVLNSTGTSGNSWAIVSAYSGSIAPAGDLFFYNSSTGLIALQLQNNGLATFTGSNTNGQGFIIQDTASGASSFAGIGLKSTNGTTTPNKWIRASGSSGNLEFINSDYSAVIAQLSNTGAFTAATGNFTSSDRRLKENIVPVDPRPLHRDPEALVTYDWRDGRGAGRSPIAQAVQAIVPAYVHVYDEDGHLAVETGRAAYEQGIWCGREIDKLLIRVAALEERS